MGPFRLRRFGCLLQASACMLFLFHAAVFMAHAQAVPPDPTLQQRPPEGPTLSITAREVLLDVVATDKAGHPVTGLKSSDFKVTEQGQPQRITSFQEHAADSAASFVPPPPLPPNTFTNYQPIPVTNAYTVILVDALDTRMEDQMMVRSELIGFLKKMQPGTPVAIFQLSLQMRLVQGFTTDPKVLLAAAESKRNWPSMLKPIHGDHDLYMLASNETMQDGFRMLGRYLAAFPGRKNLVWLVGKVPGTGFSGFMEGGDFSIGNPFADAFSVLGQDPDNLVDALTLSRVAVYPIDARGIPADPAFEAGRHSVPGPNSMMRWAASQASEHMFMDSVANATGGKAYYGNNGIGHEIAQIINDGSNYYTLAYATTNQKWEGEFRKISVTVDRPGVILQHRPGYYAIDRTQQEQRQLAALRRRGMASSNRGSAPQPGAMAQTGAPAGSPAPDNPPGVQGPRAGFDAAMQLGAVPATEIVFAAHLEPGGKIVKLERNAPLPPDNFLRPDFRDKPFRTYTVSIRADARHVRFTRTADGKRHGSLAFVTVIYTPDGQTVNSLQTNADLTVGEKDYALMLKNGIGALQQIAIPVKGNYFLRVGVHDLGSDRIGVLEIAADQVHPEPPAAAASSR